MLATQRPALDAGRDRRVKHLDCPFLVRFRARQTRDGNNGRLVPLP